VYNTRASESHRAIIRGLTCRASALTLGLYRLPMKHHSPSVSAGASLELEPNQPVMDLARYLLFEVAAQILEDLLFALLDFEENGFGETQIILL
jgi:hypothetical protein